ncbi:hypothetical protein [Streptomyces sp. KL116D]|uniref:hypothetical protein n=1 Tax=Streptomyces sp. KL116D TaxID=3045152 RepID=UPI0035562ACB
MTSTTDTAEHPGSPRSPISPRPAATLAHLRHPASSRRLRALHADVHALEEIRGMLGALPGPPPDARGRRHAHRARHWPPKCFLDSVTTVPEL